MELLAAFIYYFQLLRGFLYLTMNHKSVKRFIFVKKQIQFMEFIDRYASFKLKHNTKLSL